MSDEKLRAFIAIALPQEVRDFLGRLQERLKISNADVKWVKTENIHLTLKFLGGREKKKVGEIIRAVERLCADISVFQLEISSIGAFPKKESPRVIWAGLSKGGEKIREIAQSLENEMAKLGIPKETRPFSSHITLGRVRSSLNRKQLIEQINYLQDNFPQPAPVYKPDKIILFKSTLSAAGPTYEALYAANLKTN